MLADANKQDGHVGRMDEADQGTDHVADGVALGDDEAVERAHGAKGCIEVAGLSDRICADESLYRRVSEFFFF